MTAPVVTRFAPSPTGYLHVGGARTALFAWLFARHHGGRCYLRVEDTDRERNRPELILPILDAMDALGLLCDPFEDAGEALLDELPAGSPWQGRVVLQSKRVDAHVEAAGRLLEHGHAYRCLCAKGDHAEEAGEQREQRKQEKAEHPCRNRPTEEVVEGGVIRFRTPLTGEAGFADAIKGPLSFDYDQIEDFVLLRADGTPTYNLAAAVDDAWMGVTHVVRGDDHVRNTSKQRLVYHALGLPEPVFAHLPLILGPDRSRLSKRHGATSVTTYLEEHGYLPDAFRNYLVRLGWGHGDQEEFDLDEMIRLFDLDGVSASAAVFDPEKLGWLSGVYVRARDTDVLAREWVDYLAHPARGDARRELAADETAVRIVRAFQERASTLEELTAKAAFLFADDDAIELPDRTGKPVKKWLTDEGLEALSAVATALEGVDPFEPAAIHAALEGVAARYDGKLGKVAQPIRIAVTGSTASPPIDETLALLGRERSRRRIERALAHYEA